MRILQRVEGSVLLLYAENEAAQAHLFDEARRAGVAAQRLVFAHKLPPADYLARMRSTDLFLDTFPFNAGTTASDALWAGLPVLTLSGEAFASRMAASLLSAMGLDDLIARSPQRYEEIAVDLATHPERFQVIRTRLQQNRLTAPLFNSRQFTQDLEAAYLKMHERNAAGQRPDHFAVSARLLGDQGANGGQIGAGLNKA